MSAREREREEDSGRKDFWQNGTECSTLTNNSLSLHAIKWKRKGVIQRMNESTNFLFVFFPHLFYVRSFVHSVGRSFILQFVCFLFSQPFVYWVHVCCIQSDNFSFSTCSLYHIWLVCFVCVSRSFQPIIRCNAALICVQCAHLCVCIPFMWILLH